MTSTVGWKTLAHVYQDACRAHKELQLFPFIPLPRIGTWCSTKVSDLREEKREPYMMIVWYAKWQVFARSASGHGNVPRRYPCDLSREDEGYRSGFEFLC